MSGNIPCFQSPQTNTLPESQQLVHKQILMSFTADKVNNTCSGWTADHLQYSLQQSGRLTSVFWLETTCRGVKKSDFWCPVSQMFIFTSAGNLIFKYTVNTCANVPLFPNSVFYVHYNPLWPCTLLWNKSFASTRLHDDTGSYIISCSVMEDDATFQHQKL